MKFSFDPRYNIAYLTLHEKHALVETLQITEHVRIDIDAEGRIYGIELLNAEQQLRRGGEFSFEIVNETSGEKQEIPLRWE